MDQAWTSKRELVSAAIRGGSDAARHLWELERRWVAAILLAHKPRDAELDDLLQDVALTFVRTITTLRDPVAFRPWLRTVAINAARANGRKVTVRRREESRWSMGRPEAAAAPEPHAPDEARRILDLALTLPDSYREPLLLRCVQGMSYQQISALMAIPETTVETRIARGRKMLRELASGRAPESLQEVKGTTAPRIPVE